MKTPVHIASSHPGWVRKGVRAWVLLVILVGTLMSSVGSLHSHSLAALKAVQHEETVHDDSHGHSHDDDVLERYSGPLHSHLGSDHSHDKAHALPDIPSFSASAPPFWGAASPEWLDRLVAHRLERPPKAA